MEQLASRYGPRFQPAGLLVEMAERALASTGAAGVKRGRRLVRQGRPRRAGLIAAAAAAAVLWTRTGRCDPPPLWSPPPLDPLRVASLPLRPRT